MNLPIYNPDNPVTLGLPANANRVFKGVIFDVWQWQQKMFDGSSQVFEAIARNWSCRTIAVLNDKILILEEEQPGTGEFYGTPGGRIDDFENPLQAAQREFLEETGYEASDWELFIECDDRAARKIKWRSFVFIARGLKKTADSDLDQGGEKIKIKFINFDEFVNLAQNPIFRDIEIKSELIKAQADKVKYAELKKKLFGK
ncbi:MAG: NUDIX hydrolase [Patescibacteria group bacterium]|nr:NUDIX hydrolase [Patescibacteria group bacterium]